MPGRRAPTTCSIFIDSRITTGESAATASPTATGTAATVAWSGAVTVFDAEHRLGRLHVTAIRRGIGKMLGSPATSARPASCAQRVHRDVRSSAASRAVARTPTSPGVQKAWTPGTDRANRTPRATSSGVGVRLVPGGRGAVPVRPTDGPPRP